MVVEEGASLADRGEDVHSEHVVEDFFGHQVHSLRMIGFFQIVRGACIRQYRRIRTPFPPRRAAARLRVRQENRGDRRGCR